MPTRYLKPGICDSDAIDKCTPMAECLYYRLLVNVDDFGRFDARSKVIRASCFPLKETITLEEIEELLRVLVVCKLIHLYTTVCEERFIQFRKWDNVPRSKLSKFPAMDETCIQLYTDAQHLHTNLPVTVTVTVTETETETETQTETAKDRAKALDVKFDEFWKAYPKKVGKEAAKNAWKKAKPNLDQVLKALEWQCKSDQWLKEKGQFIPNPATYLNQGRWQDEGVDATIATAGEKPWYIQGWAKTIEMGEAKGIAKTRDLFGPHLRDAILKAYGITMDMVRMAESDWKGEK